MQRVPAMLDIGVTDCEFLVKLPDDPNAMNDVLCDLVEQFRLTVGRKG
jgi:hypothetical protein